MRPPLGPRDWLGSKLLIVGDVNTGKTTLTGEILADFCRRGLGPRITIVDLAPRIPEAVAAARGLPSVGGQLEPPAGSGLTCLRPHLQAPRLTSASDEEALGKAVDNKRRIDEALRALPSGAQAIVVVNDTSMYLQAGTAEEMVGWLAPCHTVIANGYLGTRLGGGELSRRERAQMNRLRAWFAAAGTVLALDGTPRS